MGFRRKRRPKPGNSLLAFAWYTGGSMSVPVTKFSLRMYGSRKGVEQEQARQEKAGSFVIHPYSNFRFYWDFVSLILLIVSMIIIPIAITFFNEQMTKDPGWMAFNLALDFWFFSDIIINFHTGIIVNYGDGDVILNLRRIRIHYLQAWFFVDLLSTLPIDYILQVVNGVSASASASRAVKLFRFVKMLSLLRLLRISRLIRYVHQWEEIVNIQYDLAVAAVRIFNLVCLMLLIGHWNGCLQYLVPMLYDFPEDSWVVVDNLTNASWGEKYSWSLFKAMSHMLCIGYGQQPPKNISDLWMTMVSMVSGAVCFAMFIGHTTALIQSLDSSKRQYKEKYMQVKEYMRYRRLPKSLRMRVYDYYEHRFQGKMFDEQGILAEISPTLREEVVNYNCRHLVASVPFFRNADQEFVTGVVQKLKYEVFQPNDMMVKEGSIGNKMYFIQHGVVEIRSSKTKQTTQLSDGSYFGEICLLTNQRRVASVHASTNCCLYSLHASDLKQLLDMYPVMRKTLETVAASRLSKIGRHNSVLDRKVKATKRDLDQTSSEIAQEIERHDQRVNDSMAVSNSSASKIQAFRQNNICSPNKKYQAYFRNYCAETEMTPLSQSLVTDDDTERGEGLEAQRCYLGSELNTRREFKGAPKVRTTSFIKRFFQNSKDNKRHIYRRSPVNANGYIDSHSHSPLESDMTTNEFLEKEWQSDNDSAEMLQESEIVFHQEKNRLSSNAEENEQLLKTENEQQLKLSMKKESNAVSETDRASSENSSSSVSVISIHQNCEKSEEEEEHGETECNKSRMKKGALKMNGVKVICTGLEHKVIPPSKDEKQHRLIAETEKSSNEGLQRFVAVKSIVKHACSFPDITLQSNKNSYRRSDFARIPQACDISASEEVLSELRE